VSLFKQFLNHMAANIPRAADDKNVHRV
jgi:hypothetical protein